MILIESIKRNDITFSLYRRSEDTLVICITGSICLNLIYQGSLEFQGERDFEDLKDKEGVELLIFDAVIYEEP